MIKDYYTVESLHDATCFTFESKGTKGIIKKWIAILSTDGENYNLAFGDFVDNKTDDEVISGNNDAQKVLRTVIHALYLFFNRHPKAIVYFEGVDERRMHLYNSIIHHKLQELLSVFRIEGQLDENANFKLIAPSETYIRFKIQLQPKIYLNIHSSNPPIMEDFTVPYPSSQEPVIPAIEVLAEAYQKGRIITPKLRRIAKREAKNTLYNYLEQNPKATAKEALIYTLEHLPNWCGDVYLVELTEYILAEFKKFHKK